MLIVTVTLVPSGFVPLRRDIGTLRISNIANLARISDYSIDIIEAANPLTGTPARIGGCRIEAHDRLQSVWAIVERAAQAARSADLVNF
ncbi:hypothetical protein [Bradyrhizobium sp. LB11.1]|uniref:hypothetical protein n=1 Tax=Bradyrhizobium sp. LB11.1 TaxID=3156326 RepID=UPI00339ABC03